MQAVHSVQDTCRPTGYTVQDTTHACRQLTQCRIHVGKQDIQRRIHDQAVNTAQDTYRQTGSTVQDTLHQFRQFTQSRIHAGRQDTQCMINTCRQFNQCRIHVGRQDTAGHVQAAHPVQEGSKQETWPHILLHVSIDGEGRCTWLRLILPAQYKRGGGGAHCTYSNVPQWISVQVCSWMLHEIDFFVPQFCATRFTQVSCKNC
jgi:hypothetical protein